MNNNVRKLSESLALFLLVVSGLYGLRNYASTWIWHWKHGGFTYVREYRVPVPSWWRVTSNIDHKIVTIAPLSRQGGVDEIGFMKPVPPITFEGWSKGYKESLKALGVTPIQEDWLHTQDERVLCMGGDEFHDVLHLSSPNIPSMRLECASSGGLVISFTGTKAGLGQFRRIVSEIESRRGGKAK